MAKLFFTVPLSLLSRGAVLLWWVNVCFTPRRSQCETGYFSGNPYLAPNSPEEVLQLPSEALSSDIQLKPDICISNRSLHGVQLGCCSNLPHS